MVMAGEGIPMSAPKKSASWEPNRNFIVPAAKAIASPPHPMLRMPSRTPTTGGETMAGAQASYLKTLRQEAGESFDPCFNKADASKRIDELQAATGRGKSH
jgi:hypothetical protein